MTVLQHAAQSPQTHRQLIGNQIMRNYLAHHFGPKTTSTATCVLRILKKVSAG